VRGAVWNEADVETEVLGEKHVIVPVCPPQIARGLLWESVADCQPPDLRPLPVGIYKISSNPTLFCYVPNIGRVVVRHIVRFM
jgi:hypothetical protein